MKAEIERGCSGKSGLEKKKDPSVDMRTQASHLNLVFTGSVSLKQTLVQDIKGRLLA